MDILGQININPVCRRRAGAMGRCALWGHRAELQETFVYEHVISDIGGSEIIH